MKEFTHLNKTNSKDYFDAYLERKDAVLNGFIEEISKEINIKELNFNPDSLVYIWALLSPKLSLSNDHPEKELMPIWYETEIKNNPYINDIAFDVKTANWIDGLSYYFSETLFHNIDNIYWTIEEDKNCYFYNKPIINGSFYRMPLDMIINLSLNTIKKNTKYSDEALLLSFVSAQEEANKYKNNLIL